MQPRDAVPDSVVAALRPVIAAQGGPVPYASQWFLDFWVPLTAEGHPRSGAACFQIADQPHESVAPAVMAVACWKKQMSAEAWSLVAKAYNPLKPLRHVGLWRKMPPSPPPTPWLAVWIYPFLAQAAFSNVTQLGFIETSVAWALAET